MGFFNKELPMPKTPGASFFRDLDVPCLGKRFRHGCRLNYGESMVTAGCVPRKAWLAAMNGTRNGRELV
jgi:hypothetical protein